MIAHMSHGANYDSDSSSDILTSLLHFKPTKTRSKPVLVAERAVEERRDVAMDPESDSSSSDVVTSLMSFKPAKRKPNSEVSANDKNKTFN